MSKPDAKEEKKRGLKKGDLVHYAGRECVITLTHDDSSFDIESTGDRPIWFGRHTVGDLDQ